MKKEETTIDMAKYADSEEIHEKCIGCAKVFDYTPAGGMITSQKCLTYIRPAMWWEEKSVATKKELVKDKDHPKGILVDVPVVNRICPVANHVEVEKTVKGPKLNPIKAAKRASKGN